MISTLKNEGFFTDEGGTSTTVTNTDSGMVVEVNTGSMREAFNDKNFKRVSKTLKIAKLATIRDIPTFIKNGTLVDDDVENIHNPESNVKYAYIESNVLINGKSATIKVAIRKSPRKNKFWVHTIDIKNTDGSLLTRTKNGSEVSYQTSVDEDSVPQDEKIVKENAKETEQGGFTDVPDREIQRKMTEKDNMRVLIGDYRTPRQRQVEKVAELFDVKLRWDSNVSEAYYNFETHCIFMNPELTLSEMYAVVFKHELVHHFELKKGYDGFKNYLFKSSEAFAAYVMYKMSDVNGTDFEGTYEEAIEAYTDYKYDQYKNSTEIPEGFRKRFTAGMAEMEIVADFVGEQLLFGKEADTSINALEELAQTDRNIFRRIWDWIKDTLAKLKRRKDVQDRSLTKDLEYLEKRLARVWDSADKKAQKNTTEGEVKYSLKAGAEIDVENALNNKNYTEDVYLTESSPSIIASQKGVRNLPMLMKASHIRENVYTKHEAKNLGLKVDEHMHYHGLGKDLFLKVIDGLDDVKLAYRGTKNASDSSRRENYFLLVSQYQDANHNIINVPVYINEIGQYNRVFIDTNKIATAFGRDGLNEYINREVRDGNLVRIKNKSTQASELKAKIASSYSKNASTDTTVPQKAQSVNSNSMQKSEKNTAGIENIKHSIGLAKDSGFDAQRRAEIMISRYGEYRTGIDGLKSDLDTLMSYAEKSDWLEVNNMAKSIVENFAGKNGTAVNTDIALKNLYNRVVMDAVKNLLRIKFPLIPPLNYTKHLFSIIIVFFF